MACGHVNARGRSVGLCGDEARVRSKVAAGLRHDTLSFPEFASDGLFAHCEAAEGHSCPRGAESRRGHDARRRDELRDELREAAVERGQDPRPDRTSHPTSRPSQEIVLAGPQIIPKA